MRIQYRALIMVVLGLLASAPGRAQTPAPELPTPRSTGVGHKQRITGGVFTPDGKRFLTASEDRTIRAWDVADGKELFALHGQTAGINALALAGDHLLISGGEDGSLFLWDLNE